MSTICSIFLFALVVVSAAELRIQVKNESGRRVWSRLEVRDAEGKMYQPPGAILDEPIDRNARGGEPYYRGSFVVNGRCRLEVPAGRYTVVAEHGLEYERGERQVEVSDRRPARLNFQLRPWIRMSERGWWSGDMHVHRPLEQVEPLALAEDVNLSVVTTIWNKRNLWEERPVPAELVLRASDNHLATIMNAEDERGGGAWMLYGLPRPLSMAVEGRWHPPGIRFVEQARKPPSKAWFEIEKLIWWEAPVMMALAAPDSVGLLHNHFNQYGMLDNEAWGRPRDQQKYPGHAGFADYCFRLYYHYLNLGFRVPPTAGSASGVLPNPLGYNRVYVPIDGAFSVEAWFAALAAGKTMVTNGPMLFFETSRQGAALKASVEVTAREPIDRVEIVANGVVIVRFSPPPGSKSFRRQFTIAADDHSWIAARCFLNSEKTVRLAHTSPVYLDGKWDCREDAQYYLDWLDELITQTTTATDRFATSGQQEEVLALYNRARAIYAEKLQSR